MNAFVDRAKAKIAKRPVKRKTKTDGGPVDKPESGVILKKLSTLRKSLRLGKRPKLEEVSSVDAEPVDKQEPPVIINTLSALRRSLRLGKKPKLEEAQPIDNENEGKPQLSSNSEGVGLKRYKTAKAADKAVKSMVGPRGTIYIGHLPHGFYEDELKKFFSQFGKITRLRVARSRKTGGCKGYAFIEFLHEEVAKIAADTMNNYMFFEKLLICKFIPKDEVKPKTFLGWKKGTPLASNKTRIALNKERSLAEVAARNEKRKLKLRKLGEFLEEKGIEYKVPE